MSDKYLSRAKRVDNGEWVEGLLVHDSLIRDMTKGAGLGTKNMSAEGEFECCVFRVDPATIGKCTGERDKHGKLYFEGDVDERGGVITWRDGCLGRLCNNVFHATYELALYLLEIIGNRWDNPDLLKGD